MNVVIINEDLDVLHELDGFNTMQDVKVFLEMIDEIGVTTNKTTYTVEAKYFNAEENRFEIEVTED